MKDEEWSPGKARGSEVVRVRSSSFILHPYWSQLPSQDQLAGALQVRGHAGREVRTKRFALFSADAPRPRAPMWPRLAPIAHHPAAVARA